jgi:hypothetical protein
VSRWSSTPFLAWLIVALLLAAGSINWFLLRPHNSLPSRGEAALPLPSVKGPLILKLELVWRDYDIVQIVTPTADFEARRQAIADARAGNTYDTFLFVPCYTLLILGLGALAAAAGKGFDRWFVAIVAGAALVAIADWLENAGIANALDHLERTGVQAGDALAISNPALVKWTLLPAVLAVVSAQLCRASRWWTLALGAITGVLAALMVVGLTAYARERLADSGSRTTALMTTTTPGRHLDRIPR